MSYHVWAREIADGNWVGDHVFYQAPLYPYWLGCVYTIVGDGRLKVVLIQAVLGALSCGLVYAATSRLISHRAGIVAGLIIACYAPAIFFDSLIQKSTLDLFLLSLMLWQMAVWLSAPVAHTTVLLGVVAGCLVLSRENAIVLLPALLLWMAAHLRADRSRAIAATGLFMFGAAAVLLPVMARNYAVGGEFHLTTSQFGPNFYIGNNPDANGMYQPLRTGGGNAQRERADATVLAERAVGRRLSPGEVSRYWTEQAFEFISGETDGWLRLMGWKQVLLWNRVEITDTEDLYTYAESSTLLRWLAPIFHFGLLVPLAVLGVCVTWNSSRHSVGLLLMLLSYAVSVWLFYVLARYRFPLVPLLAVFAGAAVAHVVNWARRVGWRSGITVGTVICLVAMFCNWPFLDADRMKSITQFNMGMVFEWRGDDDRAALFYARALALNPDDFDAHMCLGEILVRQGTYADAEKRFRAALELQPKLPAPHFQLANVYVRQGRVAEAIPHFESVVRILPDDPQAHLNLGVALSELGVTDRALDSFETAVRLDPAYAQAHFMLASVLADVGQEREALTHFERALQIDPRHHAARVRWQQVRNRLEGAANE